MKAELKTKWTDALRSGKYIQGRRLLKNYDIANNSVTHCCLGVLCEVIGNHELIRIGDTEIAVFERIWMDKEGTSSEDGYKAILSDDLIKEINMSSEAQDYLWRLNDSQKLTFHQIADWIDTNIPTEKD